MISRTDKELEKLDKAYNGIENFHNELNEMAKEAQDTWGSDSISIGRVLSAHLYVEYYLNKYLKKTYNLSERKINDLTFSKKILKISNTDKIYKIISGLKKINYFRNKMSHELDFTIQEEDINYFKTKQEFQSYLLITKSTIDENNFFDLYELYSRFISQTINEALNNKQFLLDNVMKALTEDVIEMYFSDTKQK